MARIAFFNERLPPDPDPVAGFSYELIRGLADQQHDIRVLATYRPEDELPPPHPRIEILRPFKNWSWWEIPRVIPLLMEFRPDIIHVVEPRAEALHGLTNAISALPALTPMLNRPALVTSFYDLRIDQLKKHRFLLQASNAITVSNEPQLKMLEEYFSGYVRKPYLSLLPVPASLSLSQSSAHENPRVLEILRELSSENFTDLIFVPGDIESHRHPAELFHALNFALIKHPKAAVVFGGGWGNIPLRSRHDLMRTFANTGNRVLLSGKLSDQDVRHFLTRAKLVFLAPLPVGSIWLTRILRDSLEASALPILNEEQIQFESLSWRHGENAWLTSSNANFWASSISEALESNSLVEKMRARLAEFARKEAIDRPGNTISRLYAALLAAKPMGT